MIKDARIPTAGAAKASSERRLHDEIYLRLRQALLAGDLEPGQDVTIRSLAGIFGTSPMPVRDAVGRLVATKALEFGPNRAVSVPIMTRSRYQEILHTRLALEPMAVRRAVPNINGDHLATLQSCNEEMSAAAEAADAKKYFACNHRFHFTIYEASNSIVMLPFIEILWLHSGPFLYLMFNSTGIEAGKDGHHEILRALRRGDADAAALAVAKDISDAADNVLARAIFAEG